MKYLHLDLRALALMRILLSAVIILDLGIRASDLEAFYSNTGAVPLTLIFTHAWNPYYISLHAMSGAWQVQAFLFLISFFCATMLMIGYRTQLFTVLSWFLLLSLHNRNILILQGGDDLLRMVMFWGIFLPWGKYYSYDRLLSVDKEQTVSFISPATVGYLLQICYLYTGSALLKGTEWSRDFTAVYYAYSIDQIAYPVTRYFYHNEQLLKILTCIAYYFELLAPLLFFIPFKHAFSRTVAVVLIILFHLSNEMTLLIGLFPYIGIATCIGILPSTVMDRFDVLTRKIRFNISSWLLRNAHRIQEILSWKPYTFDRNIWYKRISAAVLVFLMIYIFDWNMSNLHFIKSKLSDNIRCIGYSLRLDQNWGMFAPGVFKDDGWFIYEGVTATGKTFDLLNPGMSLHYRKPRYVVSMYKNDRWRKFAENLIMADNEFMRGYFCNYYKRNWNEKNPEQKITILRIIYMSELTLPDYQYSEPQKVLLWECLD